MTFLLYCFCGGWLYVPQSDYGVRGQHVGVDYSLCIRFANLITIRDWSWAIKLGSKHLSCGAIFFLNNFIYFMCIGVFPECVSV